ncbi:NAD-dependent epimerase/dehydratase family protein [Kordiimonas aestuarii]|uniref:NAD-dependent epimerase/dehydratase family protein n=1 Tax=Kordiimonas aestuarii TaxID=1005925 RepID=UPI0021D1CC25|nr:NAD(P)-dependent oxidoreductase [Kordiimonas aestuarii]
MTPSSDGPSSGPHTFQPTVALTGATGFLGQHTIDCFLNAGFKVRALTRRDQEDRGGVTWVKGDLGDEDALERLMAEAQTLVHMAALTKALSRDTFFDINVGGTKRVFAAARQQGLKRVVHVSSLAAREPQLSHYGASKAASELLLTARDWPFSWTIVRPPAIYGPGDKEILKLLKATRFGILPAPGKKTNRFAMIHGHDMAQALVAFAQGGNERAIAEIDDRKPSGYTLADVAEALGGEDTKKPFIISLPFAVLGFIGFLNGLLAWALRRPAMLTLSTARYLCHSDWTVRASRRPKLENWAPQFDLKAGLEDTIRWYRKNGLL